MNGNDLLNTKSLPPLYREVQKRAYEARAYHQNNPYPFFAFSDWRSESRGPLPKCLPDWKGMVRKSASWLFGKAPQIVIPDHPEIEDLIRQAWRKSRMKTKMWAAAEQAGQDGGIFLMYAFDSTKAVPLTFTIYNLVDHCMLYFDGDELIMARITVPKQDNKTGQWFWHREEWTDQFWVTYKPVPCSNIDKLRPYAPMPQPTADKWIEESRVPNGFGVIPGHQIKNIENLSEVGVGDLWDCFRIIDRVNLTFHLMDKSNQLDSDPNKWFLDVIADQDNLERPLAPQENLVMTSADGKEGKVGMFEASGNLRPHMMEYAREIHHKIQHAVGIVMPNAADVTNKGQLTQGVMYQLYAPLIELTEGKRQMYGEDGICKFLEVCIKGLKNLNLRYFSAAKDDIAVELRWQPYFDQPNDDKATEISNLVAMEEAGYISHEDAVKDVALMQGAEDVDQYVKEADESFEKRKAENQAQQLAPAGPNKQESK